MLKKAALVIGVDSTGDLPKLGSAAKGAIEVAQWLESERYDVACLTDLEAPVDTQQVIRALQNFVSVPSRYHFLLVYFSGHGYWKARSDIWLLSGAPTITSEAINLDGAMDLARYSGIPNVVFVSDACRTLPEERTGARVMGVDAFPNYSEIDKISKIDFFKATSQARAAYEGKVNGEVTSVLTHALMSAFDNPPQSMVQTVEINGDSVAVVPNRKLEGYLQNKVNSVLADIDINLTQTIEANVPSSADTFIARAKFANDATRSDPDSGTDTSADRNSGAPRWHSNDDLVFPSVIPTPPRWTSSVDIGLNSTIGQLAAIAIQKQLEPQSRSANNDLMLPASFNQKLSPFLPSAWPGQNDMTAGFIIEGAKIDDAIFSTETTDATTHWVDTDSHHLSGSAIDLQNFGDAATIAILLDNGQLIILAALKGFIGHAYISDNGLANVIYTPSSAPSSINPTEFQQVDTNRLRSLVALAVNENTFNVTEHRHSEQLALKIRQNKSLDPTLGLYAAHAFSQIGQNQQLENVRSYMLEDLNAQFFDLRVLLSRAGKQNSASTHTVPNCPLLTQTWNLLRPRGIGLPNVLQDAMPYLCNSLWTTFKEPAAHTLFDAFKTGEIK